MNKYINCLNYLISKKTQQIPHYRGSFFHHLVNVYDKLRKWKCNEDICYAGLFHSIYGNEIFKTVLETDREIIKNLIGKDAEELVYLYNQDRFKSKSLRIISLANKLDHQMIEVIDNIFDNENISNNYFYFRDLVPWHFTGGGKDINQWRKFVYKLKFKKN